MVSMRQIVLGKTGLKVSRLCLGCMSFGNESAWMLDGDAAEQVIRKALDLGINFFDTADVYSDGRSEEILGGALSGQDNVVVATKVGLPFGPDSGNSGLSRQRILRRAEGSLSRLKRRRIDLYQIHRWDYSTPIEETLRALSELVDTGKVGSIGASAMFAWQFMQALSTSERYGLANLATMQSRYNLVYREEEREMLPLCRQLGIAVIPYSPLAMGFLSGKYRKGFSADSIRFRTSTVFRDSYFFDNDFAVLDAVREVAEEKGVSPAQVSLAWLLSKRTVTSVILGATTPVQLEDATEALELSLSKSDLEKLEGKYVPHRLIGPAVPPDQS